MNKNKIITISINEDNIETLKRLDNLLEKMGTTRSTFFRLSAKNFINKYEALET